MMDDEGLTPEQISIRVCELHRELGSIIEEARPLAEECQRLHAQLGEMRERHRACRTELAELAGRGMAFQWPWA